MFTKFYRSVTLVSVVSLLTALFAVAPVFAAGTTGNGSGAQPTAAPTPGINRATAGAPMQGWFTLGPQSEHWYKFDYHYDINDKDHDPTNAMVVVKMDVPGCISFEVQTRNRMDFPFDDDGNLLGPIGNGTPEVNHNPNSADANADGNVVYPASLLWVGSQRASEHFYVIVKNKKADSTCRYTISISGPDVTF